MGLIKLIKLNYLDLNFSFFRDIGIKYLGQGLLKLNNLNNLTLYLVFYIL